MGVIALALVAAGVSTDFHLDGTNRWVVFACYLAISCGTMLGGWRIVRTMGTQITKIRPMEGFASGSSAAVVLIGTSHFGIPVSTTHVITGSIMGVGAVENAAKVRWITARKIMWAWLLTIPLTGICAYLTYELIHLVMHLI
jgi:PiT family inorganic phosphate transporter